PKNEILPFITDLTEKNNNLALVKPEKTQGGRRLPHTDGKIWTPHWERIRTRFTRDPSKSKPTEKKTTIKFNRRKLMDCDGKDYY
uniref:Uncharacterized protein n=1 Tax=Canis lupus dingo TaxID=286419 RepID=A0A8C0L5T4_CANLU